MRLAQIYFLESRMDFHGHVPSIRWCSYEPCIAPTTKRCVDMRMISSRDQDRVVIVHDVCFLVVTVKNQLYTKTGIDTIVDVHLGLVVVLVRRIAAPLPTRIFHVTREEPVCGIVFRE